MADYQLPFTGAQIESKLQQLVNNEFTSIMSQSVSPASGADNTQIPTTAWVQGELANHTDITIASLDALATSLSTMLTSALDGTVTITRGAYDSTNKTYAWNCSFTPNA